MGISWIKGMRQRIYESAYFFSLCFYFFGETNLLRYMYHIMRFLKGLSSVVLGYSWRSNTHCQLVLDSFITALEKPMLVSSYCPCLMKLLPQATGTTNLLCAYVCWSVLDISYKYNQCDQLFSLSMFLGFTCIIKCFSDFCLYC